jgi:succinate dehydrogenase / fumarate reductase cytochrome b subunit
MKNNIIGSSVIGKKIILGFSGMVLLGFIVGHLIGNLSILAGQDAINSYAHFLHKNTLLLYFARIFLLINLVTHIYLSISLTLLNRHAKQIEYTYNNNLRATWASKTMIISGFVILSFIIYHLLHFTFGFINPNAYGLLDHKKRFDVYTMVLDSFSNFYISITYVLALLCLGMHLGHAFFSVCQTFSITTTKQSINNARNISTIISVLIILGYIIIPMSVFFEVIS